MKIYLIIPADNEGIEGVFIEEHIAKFYMQEANKKWKRKNHRLNDWYRVDIYESGYVSNNLRDLLYKKDSQKEGKNGSTL